MKLKGFLNERSAFLFFFFGLVVAMSCHPDLEFNKRFLEERAAVSI